MKQSLPRAAIFAPSMLLLLVYGVLPTHGFMLDDYAWILESKLRSVADFWQLIREGNGFYRPLVAVTFALNELAFGLNPLGYGATNLVLAAGCAAGIFLLARSLGIARGGAAAAALIWLLNFQGIRTALLWLSGRTALILVLGSTAAAAALLRHRPIVASVFFAVAIFAKEEAVLLPAVLLVWLFILRRGKPAESKRIALFCVGAVVIEAVYFWARSHTNAMTPMNAPPWYRLTLDPNRILRNAEIYSDQIATFPLLVVIGAVVALGMPRPLFDGEARRMLGLTCVWVIGSMAVTILVPIRSDLYSVLPAVGTSLLAAYVAARAWDQSSETRRSRALVAVVVASILLAPVYYLRTVRRSTIVETGATALEQLRTLTKEVKPGSRVSVEDDPGRTLTNAFGPHLSDAHELFFGTKLDINLGEQGEVIPGDPDLLLRWNDGRFVPGSH